MKKNKRCKNYNKNICVIMGQICRTPKIKCNCMYILTMYLNNLIVTIDRAAIYNEYITFFVNVNYLINCCTKLSLSPV